MFGMGGVFAALAVYLRLPFYWVFVAGVLGVVPVGLLLGITGGKGERMASENELAAARFQGRHVAQIAKKLFA